MVKALYVLRPFLKESFLDLVKAISFSGGTSVSYWFESLLKLLLINGQTTTDFIFLGSKITADGDCSHEIKSLLLLGRKAMTNLDSIFKSRYITLLTKVNIVKAMVFSVVMYGCESWTIKRAERRRTDAFKLWCWRRLLSVPWTAREIQPVHPKGNQS